MINLDNLNSSFSSLNMGFITPLGEEKVFTLGPTTKWAELIEDIIVIKCWKIINQLIYTI